jgi:predicted nucleic acid-binding protein
MPGSLLIDSDVLIDHLRKEKKALRFLATELEKNSLVCISVISRAEILAGMKKGEDDIVNNLFEILIPVNIDVSIADRAGKYLRNYGKSHSLSIGDALIAATSKEMSLTLITRNLKHYPMKDIAIFKPY